MAFGDDAKEGYTEGEEPLHFYYNREERIKKAPKIVQDYYAGGGPRPTRGLFKVLVATRANRTILFVMLACLLIVLFNGLLRGSENKTTIDTTILQLTAFTYEDEVYVSLQVKPSVKKNNHRSDTEKNKIKQITTLFSAIDIDKQVSQTEMAQLNYSGNEDFLRTKFTDYDILTVKAEVQFSGKTITLTAPVQRR
ncbi:MAG: hypothetical protein K6E51_02220 [Treponema sp.]|nr:hypothetical protein [Treponema sp.]